MAQGQLVGSVSHAADRRKNARFSLQLPVFLRSMGDSWAVSVTIDVSTAGALVVTDRPFLLRTPVEYVLTFPPELTKAPEALLMRFSGVVLRCEQFEEDGGVFGIALRNTAHHYLARDEAAFFHAIERDCPLRILQTAADWARHTVT
jgi:PilZ domain